MKHIKLAIVVLLAVVLCGCSCGGYEVYANGKDYHVGGASLSDEIARIEIHWSCGEVEFRTGEGDCVELSETADKALDSDEELHYLVKDGTLIVRYAASGKWLGFSDPEKHLIVTVPEGLALEQLKVSAASAKVSAEGIGARRVDLSTASGNVDAALEGCENASFSTASGNVKASLNANSGNALTKLEADTASGKVNLSAPKVLDGEIDTASGDVLLSLGDTSGELEIDTASGDVELRVSEDAGFRLEIDTASGEFTSDLPFSRKGDVYTAGNGMGSMEIDTASGDISVRIREN